MARFNHATFDRGSNSGVAYAKVMIDGERYVAFKDSVLETLRNLKMGAEVEFSTRPPSKPDGNPQITEIRAVGGGGSTQAQDQSAKQQEQSVQSYAHETDKRRQMSIFYRYATDIVTSLPLTEPVSHDTAVELVSKMAKLLYTKFEEDSK